MLKKINILLVLIAVVVSLYIVITKDKSLVYILKDISIIITINLLYIIKKIFKIEISEPLIFIYVVFIFMAHFLGVIVDLYTKIYWFDKFVHFLSGIVSGIGAIYLIRYSGDKNSTVINILFIVSFCILIASVWGIFEYTSSKLFDVDPQRVKLTGINDTMGDIIVAFLGSIIASIMYYSNFFDRYSLFLKK